MRNISAIAICVAKCTALEVKYTVMLSRIVYIYPNLFNVTYSFNKLKFRFYINNEAMWGWA